MIASGRVLFIVTITHSGMVVYHFAAPFYVESHFLCATAP